MSRINIKVLIGGALVAGVLVAGGSAFTAGNTQASTQVVGYGTTTVSGGTVVSTAYTLSADGTTITTATIVLAGDLTGGSTDANGATPSIVSIGFNGGNVTACGAGTYDATNTTFVCSGLTQSTSGLTQTAIVVN
jgi:hypothetical protein